MAKKSFINRAIMKAIRQHKNFFLGDQQGVCVCAGDGYKINEY